jgi:phosphate transport system substrate-binding protein
VDPPASAKDAYPISGLTFLIVPIHPKTPAKGKVVQEFVNYIIAQGQDEAEKLQYAKLPATLQQQDQNLLARLNTQNNQAASTSPR